MKKIKICYGGYTYSGLSDDGETILEDSFECTNMGNILVLDENEKDSEFAFMCAALKTNRPPYKGATVEITEV